MRGRSCGLRLAACGLGALLVASLASRCGGDPVPGDAPQVASSPGAAPPPHVMSANPSASPFGPPPLPAVRVSTAPQRASHPGDVDVCGFGEVTPAGGDALGTSSIPPEEREAALAAAQAQLQASSDEAVRAAGLLVAGQTERLARLAAGSADPLTYAMALQGCVANGAAPAPACAGLNAAQWARLDPGNALPWLELAAAARELGDADGEAQAMGRASRAGRIDDAAAKLPDLVDVGMASGPPSLRRTLALQATWQRQSAWRSSAMLEADRYCAGDALLQADGLARCEALAATLVANGTRIEHVAAGVALGERLGWPAARLQTLRQQADALAEAAQMQTLVTDVSCDSVARVQGWLGAVAAGGEVAAARAVLDSSGLGTGWWSAQRRKNVELAASVAAEAAASTANP